MNKDMHSNIKQVVALDLIEITGNGTTYGNDIDLPGFAEGFGSLEIIVLSGTIQDGAYAVSIVEGSSATPTDAVPAEEQLGDADFADTDDDTAKRIGSVGKEPVQRLKIVASGVTNGGFFSAVGILGHPNHMPVAD